MLLLVYNILQRGEQKMELIPIGKFAKMIGVTPATLRRMEQTGELKPYHKSQGGTRYYSKTQVKALTLQNNQEKPVVGYCRVSTSSQKDDLDTQISNVKQYLLAKGYEFDIIADIGSGINYKKKGLRELIRKINNQEISKVVVLYKDRLVRFGFELIEYLCEINQIELIVIDHSEKSKEEELTEDLIQIITVFANRLYGARSKKTKKLLDEVKKDA